MGKKISQLTEASASSLTGVEPLALVQGSETKKATLDSIQHFIVNHLDPTTLTVSADNNIDLDNSTYNEAEMIVLSWSGASGTMELTLPDVTDSINLNRVIRFISDSTFTTNTHADLTPASGQTLDGISSAYRINKAYEGIKVWSNGIEWFIIQAKG